MVIIQTTSLIYERSAGKLDRGWRHKYFQSALRVPLEYQTLLVASGQNESAPETGTLPNFNRSEPQAATLVGLTSRSLLELVIGIARGFIASGISRTRLTCRSPFSRLAPLTLT